jgi:PhnB protein
MTINTYLAFSGNCKDAFQFYEGTLGGKILFMMTHAESPMADKTAPEWKDKIMHAELETPGGLLLGADHPQGRAVKPAGFCVSVTVKDAAEAERIFKELSDGGQVQAAFQKTFWSPGFGMCVDKFDVPWMVNTEAPAQS